MKAEPNRNGTADIGAGKHFAVVLGLLSLVALPSSLIGCGRSNDAGPAVAVDAPSIYAQMCARCHGADGRGDAEMKKVIPGIRDFSDPVFRALGPEQVEAVIMTGRNQMPGFGTALSRPKIQHLSGYVRRLGDTAAGKGATGAAGTGAAGTGAAGTGTAGAEK